MKFEEIYESMNGMLEKANPNYPSEFEEGMECFELSEAIFEARLRLYKAINGNEEEEAPDVLLIVNNYERMMQHLCEKAFEYGKEEAENR